MTDASRATLDAGATGPTARAETSRFRLHYVYYALAAFDVIALTLSVSILVWITSSYRESVAVNDYWAERMREHWSLIDLASRVNAPGNDAFRQPPRNVDAIAVQEANLARALDQFDAKLEALAIALAARPDPSIGADLLESIDLVTVVMQAMVSESRAIFENLRQDRVADAGVHMAKMDQEYAQVIAYLRTSSLIVADIQKANLQSQLGTVERLQRAEVAFAAVILLTVGMVTVYGRKLARRMRDFQAELTRYRDHLETLVDERTEELEASLEKLRLSDRLASIGSLAAGLGHDMNNVLFPVRCWLDALGEADLDADARAEIASIRQSVEYLQQLSDGLRLLALDSDEDAAEPGATDLQSWWDDVRPLFLTALPKEATLKGEIPIGLGRVGLARHQLTQAVFNLVVNAGAAITEHGTVHVWARPGDDDETVLIGVRDDGHGMSEEVRRQALDPFFTTKKRGLSTGLGLGLVQGVTTAVNGRVDIESAPGRGTTVTLTLPLVADAATAPASKGERLATVSIRDRRVATFAASLLRSAGFDVAEGDQQAAPGGLLWVTDTAPSSIEAVEGFLGGDGDRRVIAVGRPGPEWNQPGVHVVDEKDGLGAMREAINDMSQGLSERAG